eukprot:8439939-Pyramimonas_sp.AAC.1
MWPLASQQGAHAGRQHGPRTCSSGRRVQGPRAAALPTTTDGCPSARHRTASAVPMDTIRGQSRRSSFSTVGAR